MGNDLLYKPFNITDFPFFNLTIADLVIGNYLKIYAERDSYQYLQYVFERSYYTHFLSYIYLLKVPPVVRPLIYKIFYTCRSTLKAPKNFLDLDIFYVLNQ